MLRRPAELPQPPSDRVLRELPARAAVFLHVVGSHASIRAAMGSGGYGRADHDEGRGLLHEACAYGSEGLDPQLDAPAREAARELVDWTRTNWTRFRAALVRLHPAAAPLFGEIEMNDEARVVLAVATLLDRLTALEAQPPEAGVLDTLTRRGFGPAERSGLAALVRAAQRAQAPAQAQKFSDDAATAATDEALLALHCWFHDWATTAKAFVKRKDWLIRLGLAQRRGGRPGQQ